MKYTSVDPFRFYNLTYYVPFNRLLIQEPHLLRSSWSIHAPELQLIGYGRSVRIVVPHVLDSSRSILIGGRHELDCSRLNLIRWPHVLRTSQSILMRCSQVIDCS
jgi:hypothetical protein